MKILLFGSTGMIGTAVERVCKERNIEFIGLSHADVEITDPDGVEKKIEEYLPDVVMNSVAIIGVNLCEGDPLQAFNVNAISVSYMAKFCENKEITFVQPSSHAVFDGTKDGYYTENDTPNPINIYSASKYMAEIFATNLCEKHYVVRFPTMFGIRRNKKLGFVDKVVEKIKKSEELKIADDKIDSMTYAMDVAEQLVSMFEREMPYGVYHLANYGAVSYYDFVKKLIGLLGSKVKLTRAKDSDFPALAYKPLKTAMKSTKLPPMRPWEEALSDYVSNYLR